VQGQVTVTVTAVNDVPVATNDTFTVARNAGATVLTVLANDTALPDVGETLRITATTAATQGTVTIGANGLNVSYRPNVGYTGPDEFQYTVSDGNGGSATALVTIDVAVAVNALPSAVDDAISVAEDAGPVTIAVLANDTGLADAPLVVTVQQPGVGTAEVQPDNTIVWTGPVDFSGEVVFDYTVTDVDNESDTGTITITVRSVNDAPRLAADTATVEEDSAVTIDVLANDPSTGDPPATVTVDLQPTNGAVVVEDDNTLTYTPAPDFNGTDTFTYRVADPDQSAIATVTVTVTPVADTPDAVADVAAGRADAAIDIDVLANDINVDGDTLVIAIVTQAGSGEATVDGGVVRYVPTAGFSGTDEFVYSITNGSDLSDTATDADGLIDIDEEGLGTDPDNADTDGDLIPDGLEVTLTNTDPLDDDSDEDGLLDSSEDLDRDGLVGAGESNPNAFDSDGDGLSDGVERGLAAPEGADTDPEAFIPDADPTTTTDPTNTDSDGDGFNDGGEDTNKNGRLDDGELDPTVDDRPAPEPEPSGCACATTSPGDASLMGAVVLLWLLRRRRRAA
jgi:MYXO-CTERM domain-containing protein